MTPKDKETLENLFCSYHATITRIERIYSLRLESIAIRQNSLLCAQKSEELLRAEQERTRNIWEARKYLVNGLTDTDEDGCPLFSDLNMMPIHQILEA